MEEYKKGEYRAFEELYRRHSGKVYGYLKGRLRGKDDPRDLLQLVFLKLHRSRGRYDPNYPFLPWLFTIAKHVLIDEIRKQKPVPVDIDSLNVSADQGTPDIENALRTLSDNERNLLRLRFEEGLSFEAISARLGVKAPTVRKRVSRLVQGLKRTFGGEGK